VEDEELLAAARRPIERNRLALAVAVGLAAVVYVLTRPTDDHLRLPG
jgi:hypothetical protein